MYSLLKMYKLDSHEKKQQEKSGEESVKWRNMEPLLEDKSSSLSLFLKIRKLVKSLTLTIAVLIVAEILMITIAVTKLSKYSKFREKWKASWEEAKMYCGWRRMLHKHQEILYWQQHLGSLIRWRWSAPCFQQKLSQLDKVWKTFNCRTKGNELHKSSSDEIEYRMAENLLSQWIAEGETSLCCKCFFTLACHTVDWKIKKCDGSGDQQTI